MSAKSKPKTDFKEHYVEHHERGNPSYAPSPIVEIACLHCDFKVMPMQHRSLGSMGRVSHCRALMREHIQERHGEALAA